MITYRHDKKRRIQNRVRMQALNEKVRLYQPVPNVLAK
jgi:hypothetical protein